MSQENKCELKVVLVGDTLAGKTALYQRIIYDQYDIKREDTIGVEFASKAFHMRNNKVIMHLWDTAGLERYRVINQSFFRNAALLCIVIDATTGNKIPQIEKYMKTFGEYALINNCSVVIIETKSDLPNATRLTDNELTAIERLGVDKRNYIYVSAKLDQTSNHKSIVDCFAEFIQRHLDAHPQVIQQKSSNPNMHPAIPSTTSYTIFSIAWWVNLFSSSTQSANKFEKASEVCEQIERLSTDDAIKILQAIHNHLVKGNLNNNQVKPYELAFGGGSNKVFFIDKQTQKEIQCAYRYYYPNNIIRWLSVCTPYVYNEKNMPTVYINCAKRDLLWLFNDIIKTVSDIKLSWLRYPSTVEFYKALPTFFHPECNAEKKVGPSDPSNVLRPY